MALVVKNNMQAKNTLNQLNRNEKAMSKGLKKLASGMKINSAADDASGLSIAERMDVRLRSLEQDNANVQNGGSMLKVAEGAMSSTVDILKTMKEKVINAANDTNSDADRAIIQKEIDQAIDQIDDNANATYNGKLMLDGSCNDLVKPGEDGKGTYTHLTNQSFVEGTTDRTRLTNLKSGVGESLGILVGDTITVSYVKDGETQIKSFEVTKNMRFGDVFDWTPCSEDMTIQDFPDDRSKIGVDQFGNDVFTADRKEAITFRAKNGGVDGQISGLTICVSDNKGNLRKSANAVLDNFNETIRAQNPSPDNALVFQSGTKANDAIKVGFSDMRSVALGLKTPDGKTLNISTQANANAAINVVDTALQKVLDLQTKIGSVESRLDYTSSNIVVSAENTQSSMSVVRDADMAKEMTAYTKDNVLLQASQSMLAQANQNSSSVLSLLQ
ncbi:flagellin N-terminal helical domain-containing protein [Selenomonas ruminantium]|uniref:Flagellin n=1 Tax=Selenomonas ruminantium TaxID=971 RepID=A0A1H0RGD8_SELRU|nr:flagellin [Selenomonas ruminantium]SDP28633.1 flagellin [Selenomonas ruminantium]